MTPMVFRDDLPELRGWPEKQRAFVSVIVRMFGETLQLVHEGKLATAAERLGDARAARVSLHRAQRQYATRAAERERDRGGLPASAFRRV